jgi:hypothetical protein
MPRGGRSIILALGLILAWHHPNVAAQSKERGSHERSADALENIAATYREQSEGAESSPIDRECEPGQDQRNSDLCAQWKAADAAADSARWAAWGTWISGISGLLVLLALFLAFQSNRIARDTAKRDSRAYIKLVLEKEKLTIAAGAPVRIRFLAVNYGKTPAKNCEFKSGTKKAVVHPGCDYNCEILSENVLRPEQMAAIEDGTHKLIARGTYFYADVFGEEHMTQLALVIEAGDIEGGRVRVADEATIAT